MKRNYYIFRGILITAMVFIGIFMCLLRASDAAENRDIDIARTFDTYEGVMLVMDPDSYKIIYANDAAAEYYGYSKEQLINMTMPQINVLTPDQMAAERLEAQRDERDYIKVQQRQWKQNISVDSGYRAITLLFIMIIWWIFWKRAQEICIVFHIRKAMTSRWWRGLKFTVNFCG